MAVSIAEFSKALKSLEIAMNSKKDPLIRDAAIQRFELLEIIVIAPLKEKNIKVFAFGSRARGDHQKYSDVDLLIDSDPLFSEEAEKLCAIASEKIEKSNFPYKVDLVQRKNLAQSYKQNIKKDLMPL